MCRNRLCLGSSGQPYHGVQSYTLQAGCFLPERVSHDEPRVIPFILGFRAASLGEIPKRIHISAFITKCSGSEIGIMSVPIPSTSGVPSFHGKAKQLTH